VVNFEHPQRRHEMEAYTASGVGMGLAFLFVLQYLYVKLWILRKPDWETGKDFIFSCDLCRVLRRSSMSFNSVGFLHRRASCLAP
jgi:hypothetical protein